MVWNPCTPEMSQIFRITLILPNCNIILALPVHFAMNYNYLALNNTNQKTAKWIQETFSDSQLVETT